jgi:hypothetical protein
MRGKRYFWKAAGAFAIILIAGCGIETQTPSSVVANASKPVATTPAPTAPDKYEPTRYCQQLMSGAWVTNSLYSTTPCVPDPSYATGDEAVDRSHMIPRCFTCKLSDWTAAEERKAQQASTSPGYAASAATAHQSDWSPERRVQVIDTCTSSWGGDETLCDCMINHVAYQVPATMASSLSPDDARLEAALDECNQARKTP